MRCCIASPRPILFANFGNQPHLLSRHRRIAVFLAGPATDLVVAGAAALVAAIDRRGNIGAWSFTLASVVYMRSLWNLNPLLETD